MDYGGGPEPLDVGFRVPSDVDDALARRTVDDRRDGPPKHIVIAVRRTDDNETLGTDLQ